MLVSLWQFALQRGYIAMPAAPALFNGCRVQAPHSNTVRGWKI
jgi:hypothetical protein